MLAGGGRWIRQKRWDLSSRLVVLAAVLFAAAVLVTVGVAGTMNATSLPKLKGTIGPGYTISLKMITGTSFVGPKTVTVTLKAGKYRYYYTVHSL
jgi:hypothetical protein